MIYYPGILTCDAETFEAAKTRLRKQDFIAMPYIELKGMKDPGVVREYNPNSRLEFIWNSNTHLPVSSCKQFHSSRVGAA